jgi:hypothetical protein
MGVKTKAWGPHAWNVIHGLCKAVDNYILTRGQKVLLIRKMRRLLTNLTMILPCVYCRRSYHQFTNKELDTKISSKNTKQGFSEWAYRIHQKVNWKLFWQQVGVDPSSIWNVWYGYQPSITQVTYLLPSSSEWWFSLHTFCCYVMCDYPDVHDVESRRLPIHGFLSEIASVLKILNDPNGTIMIHSLDITEIPIDFDANRLARIKYLEQIWQNMGLTNAVQSESMDMLCQYAVIGCNPRDSTKVGC